MTANPRWKNPSFTGSTGRKKNLEVLEMHSKAESKKRTDELLRRMLATPPGPHTKPRKQEKPAK